MMPPDTDTPLPTGALPFIAGSKVPAFPTRHYPYRRAMAAGAAPLAAELPEDFRPEPGQPVYRFFLGRDEQPVPMTPEEVKAGLHDPFATLFLHQSRHPLTLRDLLAVLDAEKDTPAGLPVQEVFLAGDGGQIPWTPETAGLARELRFAIVRRRTAEADMMISTASPFDSPDVFLQVLAWDPELKAYNFYERRHGVWAWAGSSWQALEKDCRGRGPFDSHVNGGVVMKELKQPWINWHSMSASILPAVLAPNDPLRTEPLFAAVQSAEGLENLVRAGLFRWTEARFGKCVVDGTLTRAREFLRQVCLTTSVNVVTSAALARTLAPGTKLKLPRTFFLNSDALLTELKLRPVMPVLQVESQHYLDCLARYEVRLEAPGFRQDTDTHFAFLVPEPAQEDLIVLRGLLARRFISRKMAAALLMVDFPNAVFSARRARLAAYLPDSVAAHDTGGDAALAAQFVARVEAAVAAGLPEDAPEREFLALWATPDDTWEADFIARLQSYLDAVAARLANAGDVDACFRLAESRRREFRKRRLHEFFLTTPRSSIPEDAPLLEFAADGSVTAKTAVVPPFP